ncbi:hypothetical protein N9937_01870 [bacterium]|nr:hypothetical protein [bacterium]
MKYLMTLLLLITTSASAQTFHAPKTYICNPDKIGNCVCSQDQSTFFPTQIKPGFICRDQHNIILTGDKVEYFPATGKMSVSYVVEGDVQKMLVDSTQSLAPVFNQYWEQDESTWLCPQTTVCGLKPR